MVHAPHLQSPEGMGRRGSSWSHTVQERIGRSSRSEGPYSCTVRKEVRDGKAGDSKGQRSESLSSGGILVACAICMGRDGVFSRGGVAAQARSRQMRSSLVLDRPKRTEPSWSLVACMASTLVGGRTNGDGLSPLVRSAMKHQLKGTTCTHSIPLDPVNDKCHPPAATKPSS